MADASADEPQAVAVKNTIAALGASAELIQNGTFDSGLTGWTYGQYNVSLVASQLRTGGKALSIGWYAYQALPTTQLTTGQPYTLAVTAKRTVTSGSASVSITFRNASGGIVASYKQTLAATSYQTTVINFTAPAYAKASIAFDTSNGAQVIVDAVSLRVSQPAEEPAQAPTSELIQNGDFSSNLAAWSYGQYYTDLLASPIRPGGKVLSLGWYAYQSLPATALQPGKSYTLRISTKKSVATGTAVVSVKFRDAQGTVFRSYSRSVTHLDYQQTQFDFVAPAYAVRAAVSFEVTGGDSGTRLMIDTVSLQARSMLPQTQTVVSAANSYVPAGYALAFNDEFDGTELDRNKWFTRYLFGADRLNDEQQRYRDNNNHQVSNGTLKLIARQVSTSDSQGINYESGMIRSDFTQRYGYFEARVKMPPGIGMWPAFWLVSDVSEAGSAPWPPEIDIFEFVNNGAEDLPNMIHTGVISKTANSPVLYADPAFNQQWTYYWAPFKFTDDWHTIGAEWTPTEVTTYIDGKKIVTRGYDWKDNNGQLGGPAHVLLNLAVGGNWAGRHGIDASALPASFQIDWVRVYKKNP